MVIRTIDHFTFARENGYLLIQEFFTFLVAGGMPVTRHPPHRSGLEELPHPAPSSGINAQTLLCRGWLWGRHQPLISLVGNLSYRKNLQLSCKAYAAFKRYLGNRHDCVKKL